MIGVKSGGPAWGPIMQAAARGDLPLVQICQTASDVAQGVAGGRPVYLATPYSREVVGADGLWDHLKSIRQMRLAARMASDLKCRGVSAFSPVAQSAVMVHEAGFASGTGRGGVGWVNTMDPLDADAWGTWCLPFLNVCAAVVVPDLPGWDRSAGIWAEVMFAVDHQIPVFVYAAENKIDVDHFGGGN